MSRDKGRIVKRAAADLDLSFQPRNNNDQGHVNRLAEAIRSGQQMPPVTVWKATGQVVDGIHRTLATLKVFGEDADILVVQQNFKSEEEALLYAVEANSENALPYDTCDRINAVIRGEALGLSIDRIAGALHMTVEKVQHLRDTRVALAGSLGPVALKHSIPKRFANRRLTRAQVAANKSSTGLNQATYANQLINLIESGMLDTESEYLLRRLQHLNGLLDGLLVAAK